MKKILLALACVTLTGAVQACGYAGYSAAVFTPVALAVPYVAPATLVTPTVDQTVVTPVLAAPYATPVAAPVGYSYGVSALTGYGYGGVFRQRVFSTAVIRQRFIGGRAVVIQQRGIGRGRAVIVRTPRTVVRIRGRR